MPHEPMKIRVYKRLDEGTILLWNTGVLTSEQRRQIRPLIQVENGVTWATPETAMPNVEWMKNVLQDGKTDTIMIKHGSILTINAGFTVRLMLGQEHLASLEIKPRDQHQGFVKATRVNKSKGTPMYAYPAKVIALDDEALGQITQAVKEAIKSG